MVLLFIYVLKPAAFKKNRSFLLFFLKVVNIFFYTMNITRKKITSKKCTSDNNISFRFLCLIKNKKKIWSKVKTANSKTKYFEKMFYQNIFIIKFDSKYIIFRIKWELNFSKIMNKFERPFWSWSKKDQIIRHW